MEIEEGGGKAGASGGGSAAAASRSGGEAYLVWRDLTVMLPNFGQGPVKKLLKGLNGYAEPGRIMAIMGPSGSGKSTLLDSLAGTDSFSSILSIYFISFEMFRYFISLMYSTNELN